jgi:cation transport protein ChaC
VPSVGPFQPLSTTARQRSLERTLAAGPAEIWVFAYGSLIWDSGISVIERRVGALPGYRRSFCVWSAHARGSPDNPGLGLGLVRDEAGVCEGVALRLDPRADASELEALWAREMWTGVYRPLWRRLDTPPDAATVLVFAVDTDHPQYSGPLSPVDTAAWIATAHGKFGSCRDYLFNTARALRENGIGDTELDALCVAVEGYGETS